MRPQRNRKPTEKGTQYFNRNQQRKEEQKVLLQKRINKQQQIIEKVNEKKDNDFVKVIRDDTDKIFEGLYFNNDLISKETRDVIQQYPEGFLPDIFKGNIPLLLEKKPQSPIVNVSLKALEEGKYHTKVSKSDSNVAKGLKTLLKIEQLQKYNKDNLTDLIMGHRTVFYHILKEGWLKKHSLATIKSYVSKLVRLLNIAYKGNKKTPVYIKYAIILKKLGVSQQKLDDDNTLNQNEMTRYIPWLYVLEEQRKLQEEFNNILNKKSVSAYNLNLDLVLLSLYSLTPPLRKEIMSLQFKEQGDSDNADYVYFKRDSTILDLNLNKKRHDAIDIVLSKELSDILKQSYELYPRKYVFSNSNKFPNMTKPLAPSTVADRLRKIFIKYSLNIGPSILRASYVTYRFEESNFRLSTSEVNKMAELMRTSAKYIQSSYKKIITDDTSGAVPAIPVYDNPILYPQVRDVNRPVREDDPYEKHKTYMKEKYSKDSTYRENLLNRQKQYRDQLGKFEVRKRKIISLLKNSQKYRESVKESTLKKYGIKEMNVEINNDKIKLRV